ncbi:MAG: DUF6161 domain-containing protein [Sphingomonas sp.]|uniref:DUF6161 domain-containing protein n=1 Tax=Sphingomonas sp. TaxID=28214 RepID=UPI0022757F81|nr:DUF6161 domain-containing protein [Sphingomonas sp.]MCX8476777.1 DUF6161 domain-containing protein [Sphingomonas sp.]
MSETTYVIHYRVLPNVERATRQTMESYLQREEAAWAPFLEHLSAQPERVQFQYYQRQINGNELAAAFERLREALDDPQKFAAVNAGALRRRTASPPPADSIEGQLILGLYAAGRFDDGLAAYVRFIVTEFGGDLRVQGGAEGASSLNQRGETLLAAAYVSAALPFQKLTASGLKTAQANAAKQLAMLDSTVGEAEQINADHNAKLTGLRDQIATQAAKLRGVFIRAERRRGRNYRDWRGGIDAEVARRFGEAQARIEALDRLAQRQHHAREQAFEELKSLFHTQLRLRAPVALWEQRAKAHRGQAAAAHRNFWIATICAVIVGIGVPYLLGDYIAGSFHALHCLSDQPKSCVRQFSAKGPLTVAGLLLTTSLILWVTRLQYRIFLSERHLSLDADEKKAFAETFMALKEGASVDIANETIVLTSLFRPTQDGIIKDEGGGFDLSAAAILAKQMAK